MPIIYDDKYPNGFIEVEHINPYLMNAPDIFLEPRPTPFFNVPHMIKGRRRTISSSGNNSCDVFDRRLALYLVSIRRSCG